jgi:protocatechuate 3,4-dioxygenase beta subunit
MIVAFLVALASVSVSGRVVDAETNAPVVGARVVLTVEQAALPPAAATGDEAVTDKDGRFIFATVEPGRYRLDAVKKGFAPLSRSAAAPLIEVGDAPIDGLEFALTRGALISGRIVETTGAPQPRLTISALKIPDPPADSSMTTTAQITETDENGEFVLQDLPEGNYLVMAAPGQQTAFESSSPAAPVVASPTYYPGTSSREAAQIITIAQRQAMNDLQFSIVTARGYEISGAVVDTAGAPVNGATVVLMTMAPDGGMSVPSIALSDAQGSFQLASVLPGTYRVLATVIPGINSENASSLIARGVPIGGSEQVPGVPVKVTDTDVTGLRVVVR